MFTVYTCIDICVYTILTFIWFPLYFINNNKDLVEAWICSYPTITDDDDVDGRNGEFISSSSPSIALPLSMIGIDFLFPNDCDDGIVDPDALRTKDSSNTLTI